MKSMSLENFESVKSDLNQQELEKTVSFLKCNKEDQEDEDIEEESEEYNHQSGSDLNFGSESPTKQLDSVKEVEEENQSEEQIKKKEVFSKHRVNILPGYIDFKNKEDSF